MKTVNARLTIALWALVVVTTILARSFMPIDETRYVTVAWNMWLHGDYLVPMLNGHPYSDKPPLLFWLINAGWSVFGVNDWWPRLLPALFSLASLYLTYRLSRLLWEDERPQGAPLLLQGSGLWLAFTTATMFDMLTTCFTLMALIGMVKAWQGKTLQGWLLVGFAIGLGLLAKGPVILLHVLPAGITVRWWGSSKPQRWRLWYGRLLLAVLFGFVLALLWAIPAMHQGGQVYQDAILWGQTAGRMVHAFAHRRPFFWYVMFLPLLIFPWLFWPAAWRALFDVKQAKPNAGVRFCLVWMLASFILLSMISGKQAHYLLPIFPAFTLMLAHGLNYVDARPQDALPLGLLGVIAGVIMLAASAAIGAHLQLPIFQSAPLWVGCTVIAGSLAFLWAYRRSDSKLTWVSGYSVFLVLLTLHGVMLGDLGKAYDIRQVSNRLHEYQEEGIPLANTVNYAGQYQFVGRLEKDIEVVKEPHLDAWFIQHPNGKAIVYFTCRQALDHFKADFEQLYVDENLAVVGEAGWHAYSQTKSHHCK